MLKVYFKAVDSYSKMTEINQTAFAVFQELIQNEPITLEKIILLKVHFGEKGHKTYIGSQNYQGIIDF